MNKYKDKLNKIAEKIGVTIVPVKNLNDIYTKCDGFTMIADYSSRFTENKDMKKKDQDDIYLQIIKKKKEYPHFFK